MTALEELMKLPSRENNPYIKEWKEKGGRVVGFTCTYAPEEIIYASGLFPYRLEARGCNETGLADVYMHRFNCTYARCLLQEGLSGGYDFLDGFCLLNGCEQIRRLYEIWEKHIKTQHLYMVTVPHTISDAGFDWYTEEVFNFKEKLTNDFGARCFDNDLRKAIKVYNRSRQLVAELYDIRKADAPPITGAEVMKILLAASVMPRDRFNDLLSEALKEIRSRKGITDYKARLMLGGAALDDPRLVEIIENLGGIVVTDSLCYGSRYFGGMIEEDGDPLKAIAKLYYGKNPCPRMMNEYKNRLAFTEELAKGANVDGVILQKIVFCDNHGVDSPMLAEDLEPKGIPVLILEREHMLSDVGRLRTRVEAFLERIARR